MKGLKDIINLNYELFIAKRIIAGKKYKNSISSPIIKIAITAIALGIIIMLIAVATASGLQTKIRDKMAGFKGHVQIVNYDNNNSDVSTTPINIEQEFYPKFKNIVFPRRYGDKPWIAVMDAINTRSNMLLNFYEYLFSRRALYA